MRTDDQIAREAVRRDRVRKSLAAVGYEPTSVGNCDLCGIHAIQQDASWVSLRPVPGWDDRTRDARGHVRLCDSCHSKAMAAK